MVQSRSKKMVISRAKVAASATTLLALAIGSKAQETYPATPLASKHFSYPSGIVSLLPSLFPDHYSFLPYLLVLSRAMNLTANNFSIHISLYIYQLPFSAG